MCLVEWMVVRIECDVVALVAVLPLPAIVSVRHVDLYSSHQNVAVELLFAMKNSSWLDS